MQESEPMLNSQHILFNIRLFFQYQQENQNEWEKSWTANCKNELNSTIKVFQWKQYAYLHKVTQQSTGKLSTCLLVAVVLVQPCGYLHCEENRCVKGHHQRLHAVSISLHVCVWTDKLNAGITTNQIFGIKLMHLHVLLIVPTPEGLGSRD